jgi:hypothetical protein
VNHCASPLQAKPLVDYEDDQSVSGNSSPMSSFTGEPTKKKGKKILGKIKGVFKAGG